MHEQSAKASGRPVYAYYDGGCRLCRWGMHLGRMLDWGGRVTWINFREGDEVSDLDQTRRDRLEREMLVREANDAEHWGYDGVRALARVWPLTRLLAPLMGVWPLSRLGPRVYGWFSARRCPDPGCNKSGA